MPLKNVPAQTCLARRRALDARVRLRPVEPTGCWHRVPVQACIVGVLEELDSSLVITTTTASRCLLYFSASTQPHGNIGSTLSRRIGDRQTPPRPPSPTRSARAQFRRGLRMPLGRTQSRHTWQSVKSRSRVFSGVVFAQASCRGGCFTCPSMRTVPANFGWDNCVSSGLQMPYNKA
eukprot:3743224-Prymnesium_polylepis.1